MTRRTSLYTIDLTGTPNLPAALEAVANRLPNVQDLGEHSVTFRAPTDDAGALRIARHATDVPVWLTATLTTGLGIHKRTIVATTKPATAAV